MSRKLLTIAVPTYNRAETLNLLLKTLLVELGDLEERVNVIIGDNASTDLTSAVTADFKAAWPSATVLRHDRNLGAEENFCQCIDHVQTKYFWLIGDDDLPKTSVIQKIVHLLECEAPDLVYLQSEWKREISDPGQGVQVDKLRYNVLSQLAFARRVNVWVTFISGMVINRDTFARTFGMTEIRRYSGTSLVQLRWVLGVLKHGKRYIFVSDPCMLAKAGNTGGYPLLTVFGENLTRIVRETFGSDSPVATVIIRRNIIGFLPRLIWSARFGNKANYHSENAWSILKGTFSGQPSFWFLLAPLMLAPKAVAFVFLLFTLVVKLLLSIKDKIYYLFDDKYTKKKGCDE